LSQNGDAESQASAPSQAAPTQAVGQVKLSTLCFPPPAPTSPGPVCFVVFCPQARAGIDATLPGGLHRPRYSGHGGRRTLNSAGLSPKLRPDNGRDASLKLRVADRGARLSGRRSATEARSLASATRRARRLLLRSHRPARGGTSPSCKVSLGLLLPFSMATGPRAGEGAGSRGVSA